MTLQSYTSKSTTSNGNGAARALERGASLAHRKLTKSQRAVIVANIIDGLRDYQPTRVDLAGLLDVSVSMVDKAQRLSPAARERIAKGKATLATFKAPPTMSMPVTIKPVNIKSVAASDDLIRKVIALHGVDHVVDIAAAIEAAQ